MLITVLCSVLLSTTFVPARQDAPVPPSPFDEVRELLLTAEDETLIDGRGPTAVIEYEVEFSGTLHIWTRSELDLFLRVDDAQDMELLGEDDNSGGGKTPYLRFEVNKGDLLAVFTSGPEGASGVLELHLVAAPETAASGEAGAAARSALSEAERLTGNGELVAVRELLKATIKRLDDTQGVEGSQVIADVLWDIGLAAHAVGDHESRAESWSRTRVHREHTLPADHPDLLSARENLANSLYFMGDLHAARELFEAVLEARERTLPEDHPKLVSIRANLANALHAFGDLPGALALEKAVLAACERTLTTDHPDLLKAQNNLAVSLAKMGDLHAARALREAVLEGSERTLPEDHPNLLAARSNLAESLADTGDLPGARALQEAVLETLERTLPEDHPNLLWARATLARTMTAMGDPSGARALREAVLEARERTLPEDHPDLLWARAEMASSMAATGDHSGAHALREAVLEAYERTLPEDHPDLLRARDNLASSLHAMGDLHGARDLQEALLEARERTLPEDHPELLRVRAALAVYLSEMGDRRAARALQEAVLEACERTLPADHPQLLNAQQNLANSLSEMGDLPGARALREAVLEARERTLPTDDPKLSAARGNLADSMWDMGDHPGARALYEAAYEAFERTLPEGHPDLVIARSHLATSMLAMGDLQAARAIRESVLEAHERSLPTDHPRILRAQHNLALSMAAMGDHAGARALKEAVVEALQRTLPENHHDLLGARASLATTMAAMGDDAAARALKEAVLEIRERSLPADHPDLLWARQSLGVTLLNMGDLPAARALLPALCSGMQARILASLALAPRQVRQTVGSESDRLSKSYIISEGADSSLQSTVFELTETMRLAAVEAARSLAKFDTDPELGPILEEANAVRRELNDLIAGQSRSNEDPSKISDMVTRLSLERDRLERAASRRLAERGVVIRPVQTQALVRALRPGDVLVGYRRLEYLSRNEESGQIESIGEHLLAHVLLPDGMLTRVDLGPVDELEQLATAWRSALGAPLLRGVVSETESEAKPEARAGQTLRERILDPILLIAGDEVQRFFVCADDFLYLLPLDALPMNEEGEDRLGDRVRVVNEVSFARLLATPTAIDGEPSLLSFGGVDYNAEGEAAEGVVAASAPIVEQAFASLGDETPGGAASGARGARSAMPVSFRRLMQTRYEAEATADLFEEAFEIEPALLTRKQTTKAALFEAAAGKRFVHLATHGWFAPESIKSTEDAPLVASTFTRMGIDERIRGLAPMTLCGLAMAGANHGRDSLGRVTGILTAEELCSLDLSRCELAVLSACETNVGIRRAGQGIQSLQAALYAAGASTSITSLWKVDDAATRRLMEVFYTQLWVEKRGKAEALWQAKKSLRDEGHPPAHWAGWVLTGDPD